MKRLVLIMCAILLLVGTAYGGATKVYPGASGSETFPGVTDGISTTISNGVAAAGDTTIASASAIQTLRLMRVDFKPDANITGTINIKVGSTVVYAITNALADNVYGMNLIPNFYAGAAGDDLVINTPATTRYNATYRID